MRITLITAAVILGAAIRIAALPMAGTPDVRIFRVWALHAVDRGVGRLYGSGGDFPNRLVLIGDGVRTKVDYPPLALFELEAAAYLARIVAPDLPERSVTIAIKAVVVAASMSLGLLIAVMLKGISTTAVGLRAALRLWLDPASIAIGSVFGYLEPLYLLPVMSALMAASNGRAALAGALFAAAFLTKPLAVFFAPAIAAALWWTADGHARVRFLQAIGAFAAVTAIVIAPVVANGGTWNMVWGVGSLLRDPFLTGNAANAWWLLGAPFDAPLDVLRVVGALATVGAIWWAFTRVPRGADLSLLAAAAAFSVHAYALLAVSVHENHLYSVIPPLALAAATRPRFRGVLAAASVVTVLNVALFYGPGIDFDAGLQSGIASLLASLNVIAFIGHAAVLNRECGYLPAIGADRTAERAGWRADSREAFAFPRPA